MAKVFTISVDYRKVEDYHVFTSKDLYGLYVASKDPKIAFERLAPSVVELIKLNHDMKVTAELTMSFREFAALTAQNDVDDSSVKVPHPAFLPQHQLVIRQAA